MTSQRPPTAPTQGDAPTTNSPVPSAGPSSRVHSPVSSRDSSPAGPFLHRNNFSSASTTASTASRGMRSRKNSHEVSPQRPPPSFTSATSAPPLAATVQKTASGTTTPDLQASVTSDSSRVPRVGKTSVNGIKETPTWPVSPRLKSPPPSSNSRRSSATRTQQQRKPADAIATPDVVTPTPANTSQESDAQNTKPSVRATSAISTLETVEESSTPAAAEPASGRDYFPTVEEDRPTTALQLQTQTQTHDEPAKSRKTDDKSLMSDLKKLTSKASVGSLHTKTSAAEPMERSMTVETETVTSIPQQAASLGPIGSIDRNSNHRNLESSGTSLRVKRSVETIKPRKERKRASKKTSSSHTASSSSRADIFEESVQNAMDEVTSDDSDETFVYESNPPETGPRKGRHHSRTPSGASLASGSGGDGRGIVRSIAKALEAQRVVPKARSMKFASNNSNYATPDEDTDGRDGGTIRANQRNGSSIHHHLGRPNRNITGASGQGSILDDENPLFPSTKPRTLTGGGLPRAALLAAQQLRNTSLKRDNTGYNSMDIDDDIAADDEQTPLLFPGSVRARGARGTRNSRRRATNPQQSGRQRTSIARFVGCLLILTTVSVLAFGVVCFLFAMSKPLIGVQVSSIKSVIASEQELMFDFVVAATNPNLVPVTITDLDVNLFAKSKYVGSDRWWREHGRRPVGNERHEDRLERKRGLIKVPEFHADPPEDKPGDNYPTMLLGQILHFDSPLTFDGSFWRRASQLSTGSLRLSDPGNRTENGGGKRWEIVLEHDFQLIVRGVLHYNVPLGGSANRVPICGYTFVKGNTGEDKKSSGGVASYGGSIWQNDFDPFEPPAENPCGDSFMDEYL